MPRISFRSRLLVLLIAGMSMAVLYHVLVAGRKNAEVYVIMRYDDYSTGSSTAVEQAIQKTLHENRFTCSFGVIPYTYDSAHGKTVLIPIDSAKISMISEDVSQGRIEICQHGYSHTAYTETPPFSEFKGMPAGEQRTRLTHAKNLLDSAFHTRVATFIPPWNTYDANTVKILSELKVSNISADQLQISDSREFNYIPFTAMLNDVNHLASYNRLPVNLKRNAIVLLLHDYDFNEIKPETGITTIAEFNSTMKLLAEKNWKVISIRDAENLGFFDGKDYRINRMKVNLLGHLKPVIKPGLLFHKLSMFNFMYLSETQIIALFFFTVLYYYIIFLVFTEIVYVTISGFVMRNNLKYVYWAGSAILIIILSVFFWLDDHTFGTSEILVLLFLVSFLFGTLVKAFPRPLPGFNFKPDLVDKLK